MADKSSRLTIRLGDDVRTWLKAEAEKRGLDEAAFARMMLYQAKNGPAEVAHRPTQASRRFSPPGASILPNGVVAQPVEELATYEQVDQALEAQLADEPRAEELEVPADADGGDPQARLDELMTAGPTFMDELMQRSRAAHPEAEPTAPAPRQALQPRLPREVADHFERTPARGRYQGGGARGQGLQPVRGPGSLTRPVGLNGNIGVGAIQGDGFGNVSRDNFRHFGMTSRVR